jgi:hypothetical protein
VVPDRAPATAASAGQAIAMRAILLALLATTGGDVCPQIIEPSTAA